MSRLQADEAMALHEANEKLKRDSDVASGVKSRNLALNDLLQQANKSQDTRHDKGALLPSLGSPASIFFWICKCEEVSSMCISSGLGSAIHEHGQTVHTAVHRICFSHCQQYNRCNR